MSVFLCFATTASDHEFTSETPTTLTELQKHSLASQLEQRALANKSACFSSSRFLLSLGFSLSAKENRDNTLFLTVLDENLLVALRGAEV